MLVYNYSNPGINRLYHATVKNKDIPVEFRTGPEEEYFKHKSLDKELDVWLNNKKYEILHNRNKTRILGAFITNLPELNTGANMIVDNLDDCDIFINCKHDGFSQVDLLYEV